MQTSYHIREIDKRKPAEIDWVTHHCMQTLLETVPEFKKDAKLVRAQFPNFTFFQMKEMIAANLPNPRHRLLVVEDEEMEELVGHSIFSIKEDKEGIVFGFCFSRYIHPKHRRKGLAMQLLQQAEIWWNREGAHYILAQTHIKNQGLQKLFAKLGYQRSQAKQGKGYQFYELKKQLKINQNRS